MALSPIRAAGLAVLLAVAGCDRAATTDPRVERLEADLALATQRAEELERDLAARVSRDAEAELTRMQLDKAEARVAELEAGPAPAVGAPDAEAARARMAEAMEALRELDDRLARLEGAIAEMAPDEPAPRDAVRVAALSLAAAARAMGLAPDEDGAGPAEAAPPAAPRAGADAPPAAPAAGVATP